MNHIHVYDTRPGANLPCPELRRAAPNSFSASQSALPVWMVQVTC